jgi:hypothetical protein
MKYKLCRSLTDDLVRQNSWLQKVFDCPLVIQLTGEISPVPLYKDVSIVTK